MNREQLTRMAREAGFVGFDGSNKMLRKLAALVAEHEREMCAKVCEGLLSTVSTGDEHMDGVADCIAAIRARGNSETHR